MVSESASKRIARNTIFLYMRMALIMAVSLYTVRVVLRVLGVEDYGIYSAVGGIITSLSFVTTILAIASQRYFSVEIGKGDFVKLNRVFNIIVALYVIVGAIVLLLAETVGVWFLYNKMTIPEDRMMAAFWVLQCTILSFVISIIAAPYQAIIVAHEKMNIYAYVGIIDVLLKLGVVFVLRFVDSDKLIAYSILLLLSYLFSQSIYVICSRCLFKNAVKLRLGWDSNIIKDIVSFSGWSLFGSMAFVCNTQGINLVLNTFFGPIVNAAYMIGSQVKSSINLFGSNFYVAVRPAMIKEYALGNLAYVKRLMFFSTKTIFVLLFIFIFPVFQHTEEILGLWLGEVSDHMVQFVRLMLIYALLISISDPITTIVQAANRVKEYHLYADGISLIILPLTYFAFSAGFQPEAAFVISIIITLIAHFFRLRVLKKITGIQIWEYCKEVFLRIITVSIIIWPLSIYLNSIILGDGLINLFVRIIIEMVLVVSLSTIIVFNKAELLNIYGLIKSKLKK